MGGLFGVLPFGAGGGEKVGVRGQDPAVVSATGFYSYCWLRLPDTCLRFTASKIAGCELRSPVVGDKYSLLPEAIGGCPAPAECSGHYFDSTAPAGDSHWALSEIMAGVTLE